MESEGESSRRPRSQQPEYAAYKFSHPEPSAGRVKCNVCQQLIRRRGFGMHQKKCLREEDDKRRNLEYFRAQALANSNAPLGSGTSNTDFHPNEQDRIQRELTPEHELSYSEENAGLSDFSGDPATSLADTMDIDEEEEEAACVILNGVYIDFVIESL
ncbi:hypothetical protein PHLGIDRAFT_154671 [Phlebiopsis gigantea 11061_1 CR5-6]|uniref:Uncharacterized protein n=1 Tax=Phlebiopsis gigantea (strain 11061_1 CR5-6) TaxID=745531 RepID=A0A0C3S8H3_PHLG1|nr:hypothetical protein PHLGIDRAFT_154671 [Phlebiopsis gigantea 11061_1 CR5-6]